MRWRPKSGELTTAFDLRGAASDVCMRQLNATTIEVVADIGGRRDARRDELLKRTARRILGLEIDVGDFYRQTTPQFDWAQKLGCGPFLCSATVFEDTVKMLATTNCSWALTRKMMERLVDRLGAETPAGQKCFPTPAAMAECDEAFFRNEIRAGYRSRYFLALAKGVADGSLACETWADFAGTTQELLNEIRKAPGVGRYAAENLCRLLGRFDELGLDSWCLKKYPSLFGPVVGDVEQAIRDRYRRFGRWQGLALWLDLTRDWHTGSPEQDQTTSFSKSNGKRKGTDE